MKSLQISIVAFLVFMFPLQAFASIDANLKYGAKGQEVSELQEFLISKGFLQGQATGNFYSLTNRAVVSYQASLGLPTTGYVGPMTREKINGELNAVISTADTQEVAEIGVVTPPKIDTSAIDLLQQQVTLLQQQIQGQQQVAQNQTMQLQNQASQVQSQNSILQQVIDSNKQIVQNTTPVVTPTPEKAYPVDIVGGSTSGPNIYGGNCDQVSLDFKVQYSDGTFGGAGSAHISIPSESVELDIDGETSLRTHDISTNYLPQLFSGSENVIVTVGSLSKTFQVKLGANTYVNPDGTINQPFIDRIAFNSGRTINISPDTKMCK